MATKPRRTRWIAAAASVAFASIGLLATAAPALADVTPGTLTGTTSCSGITLNAANWTGGTQEGGAGYYLAVYHNGTLVEDDSSLVGQGYTDAFSNIGGKTSWSWTFASPDQNVQQSWTAKVWINDFSEQLHGPYDFGPWVQASCAPKPADPTVSGTADDTGTVTATVTNTADDTHQTVTYTVTACDGQSKTVTIQDGQSANVTFTGIDPGDCKITVTGDDGTSASTTVTVPAPPVDLVTVHAKSLDQSCPDGTICTGAHFVVTQADSLSSDVLHAPVKVTLTNGDVVYAPFVKLSGGTAHYEVDFTGDLSGEAGQTVQDATKQLPQSWVDGNGQFNLSHLICTKVEPPKPANPTIDLNATSCVEQGSSGSEVSGSVNNTADATGQTVTYTVVLKDSDGNTVGTNVVSVGDGQKGAFSFEDVPPGSYTVTATGDDDTSVSVDVKVEACSPPPQPATPVVTAQATTCDLPGGDAPTGTVMGTVENVADEMHQASGYTVDLVDSNDTTVDSKFVNAVPDGQTGTFEFDNVPAGDGYVVKVVGDDGTTASSDPFSVDQCTLPVGQYVTAKASCGAVTFTNPGEQDATVSYGSFDKPQPDGSVDVAAGASATVKTTRTSLDWVAFAKDSGLNDGMGENLAVPQNCGSNPPPKTCPSGTTWKDLNHNGRVDNGECVSPPSRPHHPKPPAHQPQSQPPLASTGTVLPVWPTVYGALALLVAGGALMLAGRRRKAQPVQ